MTTDQQREGLPTAEQVREIAAGLRDAGDSYLRYRNLAADWLEAQHAALTRPTPAGVSVSVEEAEMVRRLAEMHAEADPDFTVALFEAWPFLNAILSRLTPTEPPKGGEGDPFGNGRRPISWWEARIRDAENRDTAKDSEEGSK